MLNFLRSTTTFALAYTSVIINIDLQSAHAALGVLLISRFLQLCSHEGNQGAENRVFTITN